MPLTDFNSIVYNFSKSYKDLPAINLPIRVFNPAISSEFSDTLVQVNSAFANEFDKLVIYPFFGDTSSFSDVSSFPPTPFIDDYRYFIDLGDGTITTDLTAEHYYKYPGEYQITLVAVDSATNFYRSLQRPVIKVYNVLPDKIFLTYKQSNSALSSTFSEPIIITRYNSYQSWGSVSANGGYSINLSVSGNKSRFVTAEEYYADNYIHLEKISAFIGLQLNDEPVVANSIKTSNTMIYGKRFESATTQYILFSEPVPGSIFLGTSGTADVYYYED